MSNLIDRVVRVRLNGQNLVAYKSEESLRLVPGTDLYIDLSRMTVRELAEAANLKGAYDYALPQDWFDEYLKRHGERPVGVWWYPSRDDEADGKYWLGGRFVGVSELLVRIGRGLIESGQAKEVEQA